MIDIFTELRKYPNTFKSFREWLFVKLSRNLEVFKKFGKQPNYVKIHYIIQYLETRNTPINEAINFYNYSKTTNSFEEEQYNMIIGEFYRIENNKKTNYIPF